MVGGYGAVPGVCRGVSDAASACRPGIGPRIAHGFGFAHVEPLRQSAPRWHFPRCALAHSMLACLMLEKKSFAIDAIHVPVKRAKTLDPLKVEALANDMLENGQTTPIRLRQGQDRFVLIEGYHRLEALRALGEETVEGYLVRARIH